MIIPAFLLDADEDELFEHYRRHRGGDLPPIMVYKTPRRRTSDMKPDFRWAGFCRGSTGGHLHQGSTLEVTRLRDIVELPADRIGVFAGILGYESFWVGAVGWVAVLLEHHSALDSAA